LAGIVSVRWLVGSDGQPPAFLAQRALPSAATQLMI
jgi:hypothetical protein